MNSVSIVGVGFTAVGEHWSTPLRELAATATQAALQDCNANKIDAVLVANALAGNFSGQNHLAPLLADYAGLRGAEAVRIEAADASGGMALRQAYLMVASGAVETVLVLGAEKATDVVGNARQAAIATMLDSEYEAAHGASVTAILAMLMRRYMHETGAQVADFANFSVNAHNNGSKNASAMYRNLFKADRFASAPLVADPINLFDIAPEADGAAALVLTSSARAADMVAKPVRILGSGAGSDTLALHERPDPLYLSALRLAADRAYHEAGLTPDDVSLIELHDSATIMAALSLEATGFAGRGEGWRLATEGKIMAGGVLPISTFGGLKARGNPLGATGVYQAAEACLQLREEAGPNQVTNAKVAMLQNVGGVGGSAAVHLLGR
jgi:acetyl-CoA C-acetyltransferase